MTRSASDSTYSIIMTPACLYNTNKTYIYACRSNPFLFQITLYVCTVHVFFFLNWSAVAVNLTAITVKNYKNPFTWIQ